MSEKVKGTYVTQPFDGMRLYGVCDGTYLARVLEKAAKDETNAHMRSRLYMLASRAMRHASEASTSASATASHLAEAEALLKKV
jgi:hypothetical protein